MDYDKQVKLGPVDIDAICKKHNIGRYELTPITVEIARMKEISPHEACKQILAVDDLDNFLDTLRKQQVDKEFKRQLRGKKL